MKLMLTFSNSVENKTTKHNTCYAMCDNTFLLIIYGYSKVYNDLNHRLNFPQVSKNVKSKIIRCNTILIKVWYILIRCKC